jgi:hypothetical protein
MMPDEQHSRSMLHLKKCVAIQSHGTADHTRNNSYHGTVGRDLVTVSYDEVVRQTTKTERNADCLTLSSSAPPAFDNSSID